MRRRLLYWELEWYPFGRYCFYPLVPAQVEEGASQHSCAVSQLYMTRRTLSELAPLLQWVKKKRWKTCGPTLVAYSISTSVTPETSQSASLSRFAQVSDQFDPQRWFTESNRERRYGWMVWSVVSRLGKLRVSWTWTCDGASNWSWIYAVQMR